MRHRKETSAFGAAAASLFTTLTDRNTASRAKNRFLWFSCVHYLHRRYLHSFIYLLIEKIYDIFVCAFMPVDADVVG